MIVDSDSDGFDSDVAKPKAERMFVWLFPLLSVVSVVTSYSAIEEEGDLHPGSGNYDRTISEGSTRSMRLRLPDQTGYITPIGARAYRLLNRKDLCYRFTHCTSDCLTLLVEKVRP